jgi:hypothetical protein
VAFRTSTAEHAVSKPGSMARRERRGKFEFGMFMAIGYIRHDQSNGFSQRRCALWDNSPAVFKGACNELSGAFRPGRTRGNTQ